MEGKGNRTGLVHPVILSVDKRVTTAVTRQKVKGLSRMARRAALESARLAGLALEQFPKDKNGTPRPYSGIYWSLSHKAEKVAGLAARQPVGIDIEKIRPVHEGHFDRLASGPEWELAGGKDLKTLFRIWTAKEAVLKAEGRGLAGLAHCRIVERISESGLLVAYRERSWQVEQALFQSGLFIAAVASAGAAVRWHLENRATGAFPDNLNR